MRLDWNHPARSSGRQIRAFAVGGALVRDRLKAPGFSHVNIPNGPLSSAQRTLQLVVRLVCRANDSTVTLMKSLCP